MVKAKVKLKAAPKRASAEDRLSVVAMIVQRLRPANESDTTVYIMSEADKSALEELSAE